MFALLALVTIPFAHARQSDQPRAEATAYALPQRSKRSIRYSWRRLRPEYVNRRNFLAAGVAASASLASRFKREGSEQAVTKRRIFAVGGQAFSDPGIVLLHYLLS